MRDAQYARLIGLSLIVLILTGTSLCVAQVTQWPQFRGPGGSGLGGAASAPVDLTSPDAIALENRPSSRPFFAEHLGQPHLRHRSGQSHQESGSPVPRPDDRESVMAPVGDSRQHRAPARDRQPGPGEPRRRRRTRVRGFRFVRADRLRLRGSAEMDDPAPRREPRVRQRGIAHCRGRRGHSEPR